ARYLARFSSVMFWMSWSSTNTGWSGSRILDAPMTWNFCITGAVLSWVITCRGRMERKSPAESGRPRGPQAMWAWAIFSTTVCPNGAADLASVEDQHADEHG